MRLIDANALEKLFRDKVTHLAYNSGNFCILVDHVLHTVRNAPTVDAVEAVRCKDCKSWNREDESGGMCTVDVAPVDTEIDGVWRLPCDFCSYGERRADNGMVD